MRMLHKGVKLHDRQVHCATMVEEGLLGAADAAAEAVVLVEGVLLEHFLHADFDVFGQDDAEEFGEQGEQGQGGHFEAGGWGDRQFVLLVVFDD